jgi:hypothetical protein
MKPYQRRRAVIIGLDDAGNSAVQCPLHGYCTDYESLHISRATRTSTTCALVLEQPSDQCERPKIAYVTAEKLLASVPVRMGHQPWHVVKLIFTQSAIEPFDTSALGLEFEDLLFGCLHILSTADLTTWGQLPIS